MKKFLLPLFCLFFITGIAGYASAHCGTCDVDKKKDDHAECKKKCADKEDKAACEKKCDDDHT